MDLLPDAKKLHMHSAAVHVSRKANGTNVYLVSVLFHLETPVQSSSICPHHLHLVRICVSTLWECSRRCGAIDEPDDTGLAHPSVLQVWIG